MRILLFVVLAFALTSADARYSRDKETNVATINEVELAYVVAGDVEATPIMLIRLRS